MPEIFYIECGAVLRRWDLNAILSPVQIATAIDELMAWPLRVTQVRGLFGDAWSHRANVTFASGVHGVVGESPAADHQFIMAIAGSK